MCFVPPRRPQPKTKVNFNQTDNHEMKKLFLIEYTKNGKECTYQIPATDKYNALVRLGQIHGDDKPGREDVEIVVKSITSSGNWH